jgi:hypothetical protein
MNLSCSCGNFIVEWNTQLRPIVARVCCCEYCLVNKGEFVSDSDSVVRVKVKTESLHNIVTHGHRTADFHECKNCGVIIVTSEIDNKTYCVLNAKVLGLAGYSLDAILRDYSAESIQTRLGRRKKSWCKVRNTD